MNDTTLLDVQALKKHFPIRKGMWRRIVGQVRAVDDVDLTIMQGETLSLVGESGSGKTTLGRCIVRAYKPTDGKIFYRENHSQPFTDLAQLGRQQLQRYRSEIQMIFQDPFSSLNPRMTLFEIIGEPLWVHGVRSHARRVERVSELLKLVGLPPEYMHRFPHAFSGGQRQRIGIARALALQPKLIVCDEPGSALDVSIPAQEIDCNFARLVTLYTGRQT